MRWWTRAHARRSRAGRRCRGARSPVLSAGRWLDPVLLLLLCLNVALLTRRAAEQLLRLFLPHATLRLRILLAVRWRVGRVVGLSAAAAPASTLLFMQRKLVIPLG